MVSNDNNADLDAASGDAGDARGQAAIILVESLVHGLIERSVITINDAVDIMESALEVQDDYLAEAADGTSDRETMTAAQTILRSIAASLKTGAELSSAGTESNDNC